MSIVTLNDRGVRSVTTFGSVDTGSMIFIKKLTASSSSTISFTSGIDSTYDVYLFKFIDINPDAAFLTKRFGDNYKNSIDCIITDISLGIEKLYNKILVT